MNEYLKKELPNNDTTNDENNEVIMDFPLDIILINLETMSKISIGEQLTHDDKYIAIDKSYIKCISRSWYNISRYTSLEMINKILEESYKYLNKLKNKKDDVSGIYWIQLISKLRNSIVGLAKLRQTYSNDEKFTKQIDIIIKKLCKYS